MSDRLRVGLAGTGDIGRVHAKALRGCPEVELAVCAGVNPGRAWEFQREFGAIVYPSYGEMLSDPLVRAIDICVPNDLHRRYVEDAANAGKHILCEKPIAMTLEDATSMIGAAHRAGVVFMVAHVLRFWPEYVQAQKILRSAQMGPCRAITMRRMLSLLISVQGERGWRHEAGRMGGAILDLQIHDLDFLNWTFGLPESVFCAAAMSRGGGLDHTYAVLSYASGMRALVESSYLLQGDPMIFSMKAVCDHGSLDYAFHACGFKMHELASGKDHGSPPAGPASLTCYRAGTEPEVIARQDPNVLDAAFSSEISHFVDCVLGRSESMAAPSEAADALSVALACRESASIGRPTRIGRAEFAK